MENLTGAQLIAKARQEQIEKHGRTHDLDRLENGKTEIIAAAVAIAASNLDFWPEALAHQVFENILKKSRIEQLAIAGALIAAEIDRLKGS